MAEKTSSFGSISRGGQNGTPYVRKEAFGVKQGGSDPFARGEGSFKGNSKRRVDGCDHTSTKAPDPIRTPQLSVLGRE